jgi:NADH dehydrogenase
VEGQQEVLPGYPEGLRRNAHAALAAMGVEIRTSCEVTEIDERGLVANGERIDAANKIWAAGVQGDHVGKTLGVPLDPQGRVLVEPDLSIPGHPEAFVVGDLAHLEQDGAILPGVAQVAMQSGARAAANIRADLEGGTRQPFHYRNLGKMATIGRRRAVADLPFGVRLNGTIAWLMWVTIHLWFLVAFRNRIVVFWKWTLAYFTHERGSRLIWQDENRQIEQVPP